MKRRHHALLSGLLSAAAFLATALPLQATLGESEDSIDADKAAIEATDLSTEVRNGCRIRVIRSDAATIREYITPNGIIFAIAWNGLIHPDLTALLGSYAGEYRTAMERTSREPGRRRLRVQTNQVTVEKWGHMRNLQGRAYVPALIPPGVSIDEIK
ncbi:MAG: hypothetical protein CSYNP_01835 [Syntrophus sp. SKADARSKE-3]|nr:hypothetical protein [Syntrophus sp. SKADARSKE-3]